MRHHVNLNEAKIQLSRLVERAARGKIVIVKSGFRRVQL
jgi:prevent-host-death family protein